MPTVKDENQYGEFPCPICGEVFHIKKQLSGHFGGAHRKNVTATGTVKCKHCGNKLVEGINWGMWAVKQRNLICKNCKNIRNRESHFRRIEKKRIQFEALKERYRKQKENQ
jgi:uncharacterized C2H2 Zn-finger protein